MDAKRMPTIGVAVTLLLATSAAAELVIQQAPESDFVAGGNAIVQETGITQTHQNMELKIMTGERLIFATESMHEHDGIHTFIVGTAFSNSATLVGGGSEETMQFTGNQSWTDFGDIGISKFQDNYEVKGPDGDMVQWVLRDDDGVWLRGWTATIGKDSPLRAAQIFVEGEISSQVIGQEIGGSVTQRDTSTAPVPSQRGLPTEQPGACIPGQIRMDPPELYTREPTRVTVDPENGTGSVSYRLLSDVDNLNELVHMTWTSDAPAGASSFRPPLAGTFRLQANGNGVNCEALVQVEEGSLTRLEPDWSFEQVGGDLIFNASVEGTGHYEFPTSLTYSGEEGDAYVWSGKMHSHGGAVSFVAPDAREGTYTVWFDVAPQGPDPIVPSSAGWSASIRVMEVEPVETPAPSLAFTVALLGLGALLTRRRF